MQDHGLKDFLGDVVETPEVGVDDRGPFLLFHEHHQVIPADAGVVHQHFDVILRMRRLPLRDGGVDGFGIPDIEPEQFALPSDGFQRFPGRVFVGNKVDEDVIAHGGEADGDGAADAAAAAGDECGFHDCRIWFKVVSPRISRQVRRAVSETPRTPCRPQFWPVRKSPGTGVRGWT